MTGDVAQDRKMCSHGVRLVARAQTKRRRAEKRKDADASKKSGHGNTPPRLHKVKNPLSCVNLRAPKELPATGLIEVGGPTETQTEEALRPTSL